MTRRPAARGFVEQVDSRRGVGPNRIDAEIRHVAEVLGDLCGRGKLVALRVGREGSVGDALDEEAVVAGAQKFPVRGDTGAGNRRPVLALFQQASLNGCVHKVSERLKGTT